MALGRDERDILDVFVILNLPNIARESLFVAAPLGLQQYIDTIVIENTNTTVFPSDIRDLLVNYILVNQLGDRAPRNRSLRNFFV